MRLSGKSIPRRSITKKSEEKRREDNRIRLRLTRFLPVDPSFGKTGDNALPLTAFALAFSPVNPLSGNDGKTTPSLRKKLVRAFSPREPRFHRRYAPLKVSLWRRMSADATVSFIWTKRQHSPVRKAHAHVFSSRSSFVFKVRFRGTKTNLL